MLLGELDHRVKNILAIGVLDRRTDPEGETLHRMRSRRRFRAASLRLPAPTACWRNPGAASVGTLRELIDTELEPYQGQYLRLDGPVVALTPKAGLAVAMAIHELASNAAKYGSLSGARRSTHRFLGSDRRR